MKYANLLEWELARQWGNIPLSDWTAMEGDEQAHYIAVYRVKMQMDAVLANEQIKKARRAQQRAGRG